GNYVTLWTWLMVVGNFGAFGFAEAGVRFLPRYQARSRDGRIDEFWRFGLTVVALGSAILGVCALTASLIFRSVGTPALVALYVGLALPFLAVEVYLEGIARSFGWFRLTIVPVYIVRPLLIAAACLALASAGVTIDLAVVGGVVLGVMAAITCGL